MRREDINEKRFWAKVDKRGPDECWPWLACSMSSGHGQFRVNRRTFLAHRASYALKHGSCDESLIRHICGNPACVNPAHLAPGTKLENAHDKRVHGTAGRGVLTEEQAIDVLELIRTGFKYSDIAEAFDCSRALVSQIALGRAWAWVRPEVNRESLRRRRSPTQITNETRETLRSLRASGMSLRGMARETGISKSAICRVFSQEP